MIAMNRPCSALVSITCANTSVSPAFLKPNTTTYIPIEKKTIAHGAPLITAFVLTASLFLAIAKKNSAAIPATTRSEEHTSELQSRGHLVCRLLLEEKKSERVRTGMEYFTGKVSGAAILC